MSWVLSGSARFSDVISGIYDAALTPELWPAVLRSVAEMVGAIGAAYIVWNKQAGAVEWVTLSGPGAELKADYVSRYAALDPFRPVLEAAPTGSWLRLSKCLPETVLRSSEWYNDFVLRSGVGDILGARLFDTPSRIGVFAIHQAKESLSLVAAPAAQLRRLLEALARAAQVHDRLRTLGGKASVALRALDRLKDAVVITDDGARVFEMNKAAERMMRLDDGLSIRHGQLRAGRGFEAAKLAKIIAAAAANTRSGAAGRMLVGRSGGRLPYCLAVAPLGVGDADDHRPAAMVVVADPDEHSPSETELAELFGFTPAESRLAAGLVAGKSPNDMAIAFGLQITTLRTQIRAILKKVGVNKQTDLIRVLSSTSLIG
jgi:DNA-binding CsgD family transcriptional regulator